MANKFFNTERNVTQKLKDLFTGEDLILELSEGTSFAQAQRLIKSYAIRGGVSVKNEGFRAISKDDKVLKFLKVTKCD
ncbi:hypothetical protein NVP1121O_125 [Vibrio phage 1.121.O._10N.286.46.C4]|nr:hypothetical protein NVP1101O_204 [Vibrio phage 1.101.O._10N.261.45.C6]AUR89153.1 hypothetical protein NVP1121O_125 [Vibrio phage 1.121.O._10N.286.46.C4]